MNKVVEGIEYEVLDFDQVISAQDWRNAYNKLINRIKSLPKYQNQYNYLLLKKYNKGERTPELYNSMLME